MSPGNNSPHRVPHKFPDYRDRHHHFAHHHGRSRKIARILGDIIHNHRLSRARSRSAQSSIQRNPGVRREAADEWPNHEHPRISRIHQVKAHPVVASHLLVQPPRNVLHHLHPAGSRLPHLLNSRTNSCCSEFIVPPSIRPRISPCRTDASSVLSSRARPVL